MKFDFEKCVEVLSRGLTTALSANAARIRELHASDPIWMIAFDIIPGDPYIGIAFRVDSDGDASPLDSADWQHSHFIEEDSSPELAAAIAYVHDLHETFDPENCADVTHLILLAAAHALLRPDVAATLQSCGLDMPPVDDALPSKALCYVVRDEDGGIRANYCEIVAANRATRRLLERVDGAPSC